MELLGNIFTHYNYTTTDIKIVNQSGTMEVRSLQSDLLISVNENRGEVSLPFNSPFANWNEARRFAGPLPYTFDFNEITRKVLIIQGVREGFASSSFCICQ